MSSLNNNSKNHPLWSRNQTIELIELIKKSGVWNEELYSDRDQRQLIFAEITTRLNCTDQHEIETRWKLLKKLCLKELAINYYNQIDNKTDGDQMLMKSFSSTSPSHSQLSPLLLFSTTAESSASSLSSSSSSSSAPSSSTAVLVASSSSSSSSSTSSTAPIPSMMLIEGMHSNWYCYENLRFYMNYLKSKFHIEKQLIWERGNVKYKKEKHYKNESVRNYATRSSSGPESNTEIEEPLFHTIFKPVAKYHFGCYHPAAAPPRAINPEPVDELMLINFSGESSSLSVFDEIKMYCTATSPSSSQSSSNATSSTLQQTEPMATTISTESTLLSNTPLISSSSSSSSPSPSSASQSDNEVSIIMSNNINHKSNALVMEKPITNDVGIQVNIMENNNNIDENQNKDVPTDTYLTSDGIQRFGQFVMDELRTCLNDQRYHLIYLNVKFKILEIIHGSEIGRMNVDQQLQWPQASESPVLIAEEAMEAFEIEEVRPVDARGIGGPSATLFQTQPIDNFMDYKESKWAKKIKTFSVSKNSAFSAYLPESSTSTVSSGYNLLNVHNRMSIDENESDEMKKSKNAIQSVYSHDHRRIAEQMDIHQNNIPDVAAAASTVTAEE